jgi:hypothetical protein
MMASTVANPPQEKSKRQAGYPADNFVFDITIALLGTIFAFGLYLDGWAHNHDMVDNTFFTPWHAALYGGFAIVGLCLVGSHFYNTMHGYAWTKALPRGYMPAAFAVFLFAFGGLADMGWHIAFGIETNTEALLSPSHLLLAVSIFTILSAPFNAAWQRRGQPQSWYNWLPLLLSASMILSIISFFIQFVGMTEITQLLMGRRPSGETWWTNSVTIAAIMLNTGTMTGLFLLMLRRWRLPFGAITVMLFINTMLMVWMNVQYDAEYLYYGLSFVLAGLLLDALIFWLKPNPEKTFANRIIGAAIPLVIAFALMATLYLYSFYLHDNYPMVMSQTGLWWRIHMWMGVPVISGALGVLISYLVYPPAIPQEAE